MWRSENKLRLATSTFAVRYSKYSIDRSRGILKDKSISGTWLGGLPDGPLHVKTITDKKSGQQMSIVCFFVKFLLNNHYWLICELSSF